MHLQALDVHVSGWHSFLIRENCVFRWGETPLHAPPCQAPGNTHVEGGHFWGYFRPIFYSLIDQQWLMSNAISGFCDTLLWKNSCLRQWGIMCRLHYGCNFNLLTTIICHQISNGVHIHLIVMLRFYRCVLEKSIISIKRELTVNAAFWLNVWIVYSVQEYFP